MAKPGRPPKYKTLQEFQAKIDDYFASCWVDKVTEHTDKEGNCTMSTVRYQDRPYTMAGLAYHLDLSRQGLLNYKGKPEFMDAIKKARIKIEMFIEETLLAGKNATGPIFWLKNNSDYRDKQEVAHTGSLTLEQIVSGANEPSE